MAPVCPEHSKFAAAIATIATTTELTAKANEIAHADIKKAIEELSGRNHKMRNFLFITSFIVIASVLSNNTDAILPMLKALLNMN